MSDLERRIPVGDNEPVIRRAVGAAPVSRPAKTQEITELYSRAPVTKPPSMFCYVDEQSAAELGKSIVLTVALPAFAIGCLVGMLLL